LLWGPILILGKKCSGLWGGGRVGKHIECVGMDGFGFARGVTYLALVAISRCISFDVAKLSQRASTHFTFRHLAGWLCASKQMHGGLREAVFGSLRHFLQCAVSLPWRFARQVGVRSFLWLI
jgi:hypothetical protein